MPTAEHTYLRIGEWLPQSRANGPGNRFVVWLQGCSLRCAGCCNPEFHAHDSGQRTTVQTLSEMILAEPGVEGVTYSGGEPFEQAEGVGQLSQLLRKAGLTVMAYSGYTYADLCNRTDPATHELLDLLDLLVDGPFTLSCAAPLLWRGSRNQHVRFLTHRYRSYAADIDRECVDLEFRIEGPNITVTGTADNDALQELTKNLHTSP